LSIIFKGNKHGIEILLPETQSFEQIKNNLAEKIILYKNFFAKSKKVCVIFSGHILSDMQETELLKIISDQTGLDALCDKTCEKINSKFETNLIKNLNQENLDQEKIILQLTGNLVYKNSLRSGQFIKYKGSVIILGDVNSGAEIIASGNIIVMGKIKGLVHAGCDGDENFIISSFGFLPVQIRIASIITCVPEIISSPVYAYVKNNKLYISLL